MRASLPKKRTEGEKSAVFTHIEKKTMHLDDSRIFCCAN
jgi:hypothetical protein